MKKKWFWRWLKCMLTLEHIDPALAGHHGAFFCKKCGCRVTV
jgi:hypothetical protein